MVTLKMGSTGQAVKRLQLYLGMSADGSFGPKTNDTVKQFQSKSGLVSDGIVGLSTWISLYSSFRAGESGRGLTRNDYDFIAFLIGCDIASIKSVRYVETGGKSGFLDETNNRPIILFEGHIFWKELKNRGLDPNKYLQGNKDILYKSWTKDYYVGSYGEWNRLEKAIKINRDAALSSASWGMFQVMGNNYKACGCTSVSEFVNLMCRDSFSQLLLTARFIMSSKKLVKALSSHNWSDFAKIYNGPSYKSNNYDKKLESAYNLYK